MDSRKKEEDFIYPVPEVVLSRREFSNILSVHTLELPYARMRHRLPPFATVLGDDCIAFYNTEKEVTFRKRFSRKRVTRKLYYMEVDRSLKFETKVIFHLS